MRAERSHNPARAADALPGPIVDAAAADAATSLLVLQTIVLHALNVARIATDAYHAAFYAVYRGGEEPWA
ncbi:MAG TPA: hypothetical protein PLT85_03875 [Thauera aminoaromatica]|nr:hypothetical protein [Accumulibacter sp.]HMW56396.1 hypothetical protein [Accumulibacter sp.]HMW79174.1 hypothetical protein [Accumulibacter sp.]HNC66177.1 hypothetical protein [Thauera aminoaromatica]